MRTDRSRAGLAVTQGRRDERLRRHLLPVSRRRSCPGPSSEPKGRRSAKGGESTRRSRGAASSTRWPPMSVNRKACARWSSIWWSSARRPSARFCRFDADPGEPARRRPAQTLLERLGRTALFAVARASSPRKAGRRASYADLDDAGRQRRSKSSASSRTRLLGCAQRPLARAPSRRPGRRSSARARPVAQPMRGASTAAGPAPRPASAVRARHPRARSGRRRRRAPLAQLGAPRAGEPGRDERTHARGARGGARAEPGAGRAEPESTRSRTPPSSNPTRRPCPNGCSRRRADERRRDASAREEPSRERRHGERHEGDRTPPCACSARAERRGGEDQAHAASAPRSAEATRRAEGPPAGRSRAHRRRARRTGPAASPVALRRSPESPHSPGSNEGPAMVRPQG